MVIVPADKLAAAITKHLLPGLLRSLSTPNKESVDSKTKSS